MRQVIVIIIFHASPSSQFYPSTLHFSFSHPLYICVTTRFMLSPFTLSPLLFSVFVYPSHCHIFARFHFYRELNQVVGTVVLDTTIFQVYFVLLSFFNQNIHTTEQWRR